MEIYVLKVQDKERQSEKMFHYDLILKAMFAYSLFYYTLLQKFLGTTISELKSKFQLFLLMTSLTIWRSSLSSKFPDLT